MKQKQSKFTLRIGSKTLHKFDYMAKRNLRSINKELERVIKKYIEEYEKRYGKVE